MDSADNADNVSVQASVSYNSVVSDQLGGIVQSDSGSQSVHTTVTHGTQGTVTTANTATNNTTATNSSHPSSPSRTSYTPLSMSPSSASAHVHPDVLGTLEPMPQYPQQHGDIFLGMQQLELQARQQQQQQGLHNTYEPNRERSNPVSSDDDHTEQSSSVNTGENPAGGPRAGYIRSEVSSSATSTFGKLIQNAAKNIQVRNSNNNNSSNTNRKVSNDEEGVVEGALIYGYLQKLGRNGKWQTRWFETDGECLTYYKSSKRVKLLATLDLAKVGSIVINHDDEKGCCFTINISERPYHLRADSSAACKDWVITLNRVKEARMKEGNVKLVMPEDMNLPPDLLDQSFTPRVVVVANRQRTHAVEDDDFPSWEAMSGMNENDNPAGKYSVVPPTSSRLARWQKPKTSIARIASKVLAWARSIRNYRCHDAENQVILDHHLHPPGHDDKIKRIRAAGNRSQPQSAAVMTTDHSPTAWIQNKNSNDRQFPPSVVTTTDLLDNPAMSPSQSPATDNVSDDEDDARFLS